MSIAGIISIIIAKVIINYELRVKKPPLRIALFFSFQKEL
jgi:hypothetical protein